MMVRFRRSGIAGKLLVGNVFWRFLFLGLFGSVPASLWLFWCLWTFHFALRVRKLVLHKYLIWSCPQLHTFGLLTKLATVKRPYFETLFEQCMRLYGSLLGAEVISIHFRPLPMPDNCRLVHMYT